MTARWATLVFTGRKYKKNELIWFENGRKNATAKAIVKMSAPVLLLMGIWLQLCVYI